MPDRSTKSAHRPIVAILELRRKLVGVIAEARGEGLSKDDNFPHLVSGDNPRIVDKPPTIFHLDPKADARHKLGVQRLLSAYHKGLNPDRLRLLDRFTLKDLAFKAAGVGSVGPSSFRRPVFSQRQRTLFLQVKQAQKSVLERLAASGAKTGPHCRGRARPTVQRVAGVRALELVRR